MLARFSKESLSLEQDDNYRALMVLVCRWQYKMVEVNCRAPSFYGICWTRAFYSSMMCGFGDISRFVLRAKDKTAMVAQYTYVCVCFTQIS